MISRFLRDRDVRQVDAYPVKHAHERGVAPRGALEAPCQDRCGQVSSVLAGSPSRTFSSVFKSCIQMIRRLRRWIQVPGRHASGTGLVLVALLASSVGWAESPDLAATITPGASPAHQRSAQTVHINRASQRELAKRLHGVGMKTAGYIILFRRANGPFRSLEELLLVKGIGPAILERNRSIIRID